MGIKLRLHIDSEVSATIREMGINRSERINQRDLVIAAGTFTGFYCDIPIALKAQHHISHGDLDTK